MPRAVSSVGPMGAFALGCAVACGGAYAAEQAEPDPILDAPDASEEGGSSNDATPTPDSQTANPDAPVDPVPFCQQKAHTFCDDFDQETFGLDWTEVVTGANAASSLDDASAVSRPNAYRVVTARDGGQGETFLLHRRPGIFKQAVVEADVMVESAPADPSRTVGLFEVALGLPSQPNWHLRVHHYANKIEVLQAHYNYPDAGYGFVFTPKAQLFVPGAWTHVRIEVTATTALKKAHGKIAVGASTIFDEDLAEPWQPGAVEVRPGGYALYWGGGDWKLRFDNVTLDAE